MSALATPGNKHIDSIADNKKAIVNAMA